MKKGKKPYSGKVSRDNKTGGNLGTKRDEFGVQGSTKGEIDPRAKSHGKPLNKGGRPSVNHG